jgi:hypothetical protein
MMIWGTKRKLDKLGTAADFCPICRQVQPFEISQIRMVKHFYYITYGKGNIVGQLAVCQDCGLQLFIDAGHYPNLAEGHHHDLKALIEKTNPGLKEELAQRVSLEKRIWKKESLTPEERRFLIGEPFNVMAPMLTLRYRDSLPLDKATGRSCLLTVSIPLLVLFIASLFSPSILGDYLKLVAYGLVGILVLYTIYTIFTTQSRYLDSKIYPMFARALSPLDPSLDELQTVVKKYKDLGLITGKKIKPQKVLEAIRQRPTQK